MATVTKPIILDETGQDIVAALQIIATHAAGLVGQGVPAGGTTGQVLKKKSGTDYDTEWADESGGSSVSPYTSNPAPLGTASPGSSDDYARGDHVHPNPTPADIGAGTYSKPSGGIPATDLASAVQTSLGKADTALQKAGGTMSGAIAMGGNKVTGLGTPSADGDAATKKYVDDEIAGIGTVFNIKGDVATVNDLPATGNAVGDVYYVQSVSAAFIWLETTAHPTGYWEEFGEPIDLSGYIEKPSSASTNQILTFNGTTWVAANKPSYTASDVGAVAANQGSGNAGKFLVVGSDGVVVPVTMQTWQGGSY